ncbi:DNA helicase MCM9-like [Chelonus insularis]|uniref:DNA helicase MCM9-like n=1 Tax=Chelonus insularis TaxID=460826 RepID=UPI001589B27A|nr:DNA helicase MCM9-like [Chelonus insularis]
MLKDYFIKHHAEDLQQILDAPDEFLHYSIIVDCFTLSVEDPETCDKILHRPRYYLHQCDKSAVKAQEELINNDKQTVKKKVHTRIDGAPLFIKNEEIGALVSRTGITVRISQPTVMKLIKRFSCKKCDHITEVKLDWERQKFEDVKQCGACESKSVTLIPSLQEDDCADYQEVKIQERKKPKNSSSYSVGIQAILLDDLVNKIMPGDDVQISGVIIRRWGNPQLTESQRTDATTVMIANNVAVLRKVLDSSYPEKEIKEIFENYWKKYQDNPLVGRNNLLASICPQLFGMYTVKLALAIVLAGGVPKVNQTGVRVRGDPHLLMIGDPGTGKSQILRTVAKLASRAVVTTGIGTTAAGLTAAAVRDSDGWHLEAGALVLADGGVCCVDEFTTMSSNDRASLHEAMEQQTISIAKAGLVSTLNSRCSVIAAINPVGGRIVPGEEVKTRLGNPLLSRFDLILYLKDNKNSSWDQMTVDHILRIAYEDDEEQNKISLKQMEILKSEGLWNVESLREYFSHIHTLNPELTEDAEKILTAVFLYHRSNPYRKEERTTVRLLDSLIRLAEGHARLMYKTQVDVMDAIIAAQLIGTVPMPEDIGCPFPDDPAAAFEHEKMKVLEELQIDDLESES